MAVHVSTPMTTQAHPAGRITTSSHLLLHTIAWKPHWIPTGTRANHCQIVARTKLPPAGSRYDDPRNITFPRWLLYRRIGGMARTAFPPEQGMIDRSETAQFTAMTRRWRLAAIAALAAMAAL